MFDISKGTTSISLCSTFYALFKDKAEESGLLSVKEIEESEKLFFKWAQTEQDPSKIDKKLLAKVDDAPYLVTCGIQFYLIISYVTTEYHEKHAHCLSVSAWFALSIGERVLKSSEENI
ncbi:Hypothetical predicted protein [Paramuricea clavata]|uniref:Uncharacterized protein n=1 Tax=Paramuricea clavata TaxID=317549 RepID=A0A7D9EV61_PARCT|nr:Hypothetical predicted protein [Paramuricea clavata]